MKYMKKAMILATALGVAALPVGVSQAAAVQQTSGGFNVTVALTSVCNLGSIANVAFTYSSFQVGASSSTGGGFNITCTNTLAYSFVLDATSGTVPTVNLAYTLTTPTASAGTGASQSYTIAGSMAGGQAGTCATATCNGTDARTLQVWF